MKRAKLSGAMVFILLFGIVALFSDMTGEGANSIRGAYLALMGASAAVIGFVSGLGELIGYSLRFAFGVLVDKTRRYWPMTVIGYVVDLLAVPALALVGQNGWILAGVLIVIGRVGKAMKKPAKSTLVSFAGAQEGAGKSFAILEVIDQIGAFLGPVMLYLVMLFRTSGTTFQIYSFCFAVLLIPALASIAMLFVTKQKFPNPERFEPEPTQRKPFRMERRFLLYLAGSGLFAFGFVDYSIVIMHVSRHYTGITAHLTGMSALVSSGTIPLLYAGAMLVDAVAALVFGLMYDKKGILALVIATAIAAPFGLFVFCFNSVPVLLVGIALWGVGMGAQESIMLSVVSHLVPKSARATGYGVFDCSFGVFWFLGSWLLGYVYELSIPAMVAISMATQLAAIPIYVWAMRRRAGVIAN